MPAQTWDEILAEAKLSASEKQLIDNIVQRVPEFKDGRLRQADYSKNMAELQGRKKEYDDAVATKERINTWYEERKPVWDELVAAGAVDEDGEPVWPKEKARLAKELDDAKKAAVAGADMDPAELTRRVQEIVKANGGATVEEQKALIASEAKKLAEETFEVKYKEVQKEFNEKTIPFTTGFATSMAIMAGRYEKETGEEWTDDKQKEVFELMARENDFNPRSAVTKYMKPAVDKKSRAVEIKAEAEKLAKQMLVDRGEVLGDQPFIPQGSPNEKPQGSLQRLLEQSAAEEGDTESLVMAAGRKAAAEMRNEGKF
jgi:hypothetical protein